LKEISRQQGELSVLRKKQDAREQEIAALKKQLAELEKELAEEKKKNLQPPASSPASSPTAEESL
jgi:flagellar motility protein MotE (MotC chaperone)